MNEEQATKILAGVNQFFLEALKTSKGDDRGAYLIDDWFTADELEAIAWLIRNKNRAVV